ncbi:MAG: hypothetical protein IT328_06290 [Caldilineaceae bacterium]|nr:hypothetical protein [Caldilineaceae bacterium]
MATFEPTRFERLMRAVQLMPLWRKVLLTLLLLALPFGLADLEGIRATLLNRDTWRTAYFPTVALLYMIAVAPWIRWAEKEVIKSLQPLIKIELNSDEALAYRGWWRSSWGEWGAFGAGLLAGLLLLISQPIPDLRYWTVDYWIATILIACGALAWLIYAALGSARLTALLHHHILHEDPFDITPFEPVGRQGLVLAMIFVGAITLSLLFIYGRTVFWTWQDLVIYSVLLLATVSIFFTVMWPTHRILRHAKLQELAGIQRLIGQTMRKLEARVAEGADTQSVVNEVPVLLTLEQRLKQTRTWPYDTEMLRTLFISVLVPLILAGIRAVGTYLTQGHF